jgi:hypothetical protein
VVAYLIHLYHVPNLLQVVNRRAGICVKCAIQQVIEMVESQKKIRSGRFLL